MEDGALDDNDAEFSFFALRIFGMSWGVKNTFFEAPGVSLGGSVGEVKILRVGLFSNSISLSDRKSKGKALGKPPTMQWWG